MKNSNTKLTWHFGTKVVASVLESRTNLTILSSTATFLTVKKKPQLLRYNQNPAVLFSISSCCPLISGSFQQSFKTPSIVFHTLVNNLRFKGPVFT
jgi:hypothetical protein